MKNRPAKALVAVLVGTGALVGAGAAVVWHVAVPTGATGYASVRPPWFPVSLYFVAAGVVVALIASSFLVDAGLRLRIDRHRPKKALFALLVVLGGVLGAGAAVAWTYWPPETADALVLEDTSTAYWERQSSLSIVVGGISEIPPLVSETTATAYADYTERGDTFRPTVEHPWLIFPLGGAAIAAALAWSLSLRDVRLTSRSMSE